MTDRSAAIDKFLAGMKPRGRLIFALDATMSRQPTWDAACHLQGQMFAEAAAIGGLDIQLVYFRGGLVEFSEASAECRASRWVTDPFELAKLMERIDCRAGKTQIGRVLAHAGREHEKARVGALVFVGDTVEEPPAQLYDAAAGLPPTFMFQEGRERAAEQVYREIARLTRGAYCRFDTGAAQQLAALLQAVAAFAAGGLTALAARRDPAAVKLLGQLRQ
jgi:hypothetical protein